MNVVITGLGPATVAGLGAEATLKTIASPPPDLLPQTLGDLGLADHLKAAKTYLDRNSQLAMLASSIALDDAGLLPPTDDLNVGVSFGTAFGNLQTTETFLDMLRQKGPKLASPLLFIHSYPNTSSSLIAIEWSLTGPALNFCSGSSAGADALIAAADAVADGTADVMLTGGADADGKLLSASRPGDDFRDAFREGAGMMTLEAAARATEREAVIYARLTAWSRGTESSACAEQALRQAEISPDEIDLVVSAGVTAPDDIAQQNRLNLHRYTGETLAADAPLAVIAAVMHLEADPDVRNALVLTTGVNEAAFVLSRHEET